MGCTGRRGRQTGSEENTKFRRRGKSGLMACKAAGSRALEVKGIGLFSLFSGHCQIKFGMWRPFRIWRRGLDRAQEQPRRRQIARNQVVLDRLAALDCQLAHLFAAGRNSGEQQLFHVGHRLVGLPAVEIYRTARVNAQYDLNHTEICLPVMPTG